MQEDNLGKITPRSLIVNIPDTCGYEKIFAHNLDLKDPGVSYGYVNWCVENCIGLWGWWFERDISKFYTDPDNHTTNAYLSFEMEEDLVLFNLTHDISHQHTK